ncbi:type 2 lanthipeptide synthetase LanM [Anaerosacchariphilus polymeriproducens]|uniref:Type 2 lantipeptide synthetase LanM n=1 Tax=Anaerosacchariphilus polymeriproducens TaxID=1812858 RepID=A0A371AYL4_9FIRM|nr:type 2 lanthipeptide synthetase LanM [Anaerosacchariphilus polymeriproducens]RDU24643.1 type 2 lantipeptide synthetase LanM [Anaerosacchariphilus polymeriproducens]
MENCIEYSQKYETEKEKILSFWNRLFPEKKENNVLGNLLEKISGKTAEDFLNNYFKEEEVLDEIKQMFSDINKSYYIDILDEILTKQKNRWSFFFKPILLLHMDKIMELVKLGDILENEECFIESVLENIIGKLTALSYRTIIQEINVAKIDERLEGKTSVERGTYYTNKLLKDMQYLKEVYLVYPELYKEMRRTVSYSINYVHEILLNTKKYINELERTLNDGKPLGKINSIILGNGDTHNNGKTVATVKFGQKILMYKPRSFAMERSYDAFLNWVNKRIPDFSPLKSCKTYSIKEAGWMEFVEHKECKTKHEIGEFYLKTGELLCLLYTLNSKDCHCENLIANGKYPIFIDLETLLHTNEYDKEEEYDSVEAYIHNYIQNSVNSVLILPSLLQNFNTNEVMEIGAIGSGKAKKSPFKTQKITNFDSDTISVENVYKEIPESGNYPLYKGEQIGGNGYIGHVKQGFISTYQWILNNKEEYIEKIKELFSNVECRVIYKATNDYTQLMSTSYHPDLLHNKMDRIVYFHRIGILIKNNEKFDEKKIYQTEIEAMLNGDVPSFNIIADSKKATNFKNEVVYDKYKKSIIETVEEKIQKLSAIDLERQAALIYLSYIGCKMKTDLPVKTNTQFTSTGSLDINCDYLKEARIIGEKIIERGFSVTVNNKVENSWICYIGFGDDYYSINPVGWDLYKGNCGIALYFMYLGKTLKEEKYIQYAKDTLNSVERMINLNHVEDIETMGLGVFTGIYSYVFVTHKFIKLNVYNKAELKQVWNYIYKILEFTEVNISKQDRIDILSGISGIMGILISIYDNLDKLYQDVVKNILIKIVNKLKQEAIQISEEEISWTDNGDIGYAHGNAGIMSQLARCYDIIKDPEILIIIHKSLNYERNIRFNKESNMWIIRENTHYYSWCNGIAGLLLSKIILHQSSAKDEKLMGEIKLLINQLKKYGFGNDYSICHGDIGSVSILRYAADFMYDNMLEKQCAYTVNNFVQNHLFGQADSLYALEDWGLMVGSASKGMGLLDEFNHGNIIADLLCLK